MRHLLLIGAATLLMACSGPGGDKPVTMTVVDSTSDHTIAAQEAAIASLPKFLKTAKNPPPSWSAISVKVAFPTRDDSLEHIWMSEFSASGVGFVGTLGNEPYNVEGLSHGDKTVFSQSDITDWQYMKDGKLYGHYTTRAMLDTMSPEQRRQMLSLLSETPE